jgi:hypothetical protein
MCFGHGKFSQGAIGKVGLQFLGQVLHDWAEAIVKHHRSAADSKIELVIVEQVMAAREIPGAEIPVPPPPATSSQLG